MRFSVLATALAVGSALAAPIASSAATGATSLIQNLNKQLQNSGDNIQFILKNENDKKAAAKDVSGELQKMTGSISSTVGSLGGATGLGMQKVGKRGDTLTPDQIKKMDQILAERIRQNFSVGHLDLDLPIIPEVLPSDGKASKSSKRDTAGDLNDAMSTTVDTVSDTTSAISSKLGSDAPTPDMIAVYGALTTLASGVQAVASH